MNKQNADFTVKGVVVDKETGKAIKGIRVSCRPINEPMYMYGIPQSLFEQKSTVLTDENGAYKITKNEFCNLFWFVHEVKGIKRCLTRFNIDFHV